MSLSRKHLGGIQEASGRHPGGHGKYPKWSPGVSWQTTLNVLWVNYESVDTCVTATAWRRHDSRPTHLPGPLESMGPYRYMCCSTSSYAEWPWKGPLMDGRTHPTASWMPLPGTTKPSPYHWLAIMSKNHVICTKLLLLLGKYYE